jgi:iron(III) transport system substrate-binding protein
LRSLPDLSSRPSADGSVNVYTYREPALITPLFEEFTSQTGIAVNVIFAKDGLEQRIMAEGDNSPPMCFDRRHCAPAGSGRPRRHPGRWRHQTLDEAVPADLRDPTGTGTAFPCAPASCTHRTERVTPIAHLPGTGRPEVDGQDLHPLRPAHLQQCAVRGLPAHHGEDNTEAGSNGLKANLARRPSGGDRDVAKDIAAGVCDIGIANTYYVGLMVNGTRSSRRGHKRIKVIMPTFEDGGTHINISGVVLARNAPNKDNAVKLMEWLVSDQAQQHYASMNYEYPVADGVPLDPTVASWGELQPDDAGIERHRGQQAQGRRDRRSGRVRRGPGYRL